jgi:hypothetical protein
MKHTAESRARFEHVARLFLVLVAGLLTFLALIAFTSTGWGVASNNVALLALRHLGALVTPWAAVYFETRGRCLASALMMTLATPFYLWLEDGWGVFGQPASGYSVISGLPAAAAGVALLIHLVRLDGSRTATASQ